MEVLYELNIFLTYAEIFLHKPNTNQQFYPAPRDTYIYPYPTTPPAYRPSFIIINTPPGIGRPAKIGRLLFPSPGSPPPPPVAASAAASNSDSHFGLRSLESPLPPPADRLTFIQSVHA